MRVPEHVAPVAKKALKMPVLMLFYRHYMDAARSAMARSRPSARPGFAENNIRTCLYIYV